MSWKVIVGVALAMGCGNRKCKEALAHFALPAEAKVVKACVDDKWTEGQIACIKQAPNWTGLDFCSLDEAQRRLRAASRRRPGMAWLPSEILS